MFAPLLNVLINSTKNFCLDDLAHPHRVVWKHRRKATENKSFMLVTNVNRYRLIVWIGHRGGTYDAIILLFPARSHRRSLQIRMLHCEDRL